MYRASLYLSRALAALTLRLYQAFIAASDARDDALTKAKAQRTKAASLRLAAAATAAENAKVTLQVETANFKAELKAAKEMI